MEKKWYVVHTYSGCEKKVKTILEEKVKSEDPELELFGEVLVPTENVVEIRDGKKKVSNKKFFPGYVLVEMDMTDKSRQMVREIPKVTGFLGGNEQPIPLSEDEVARITTQVETRTEKPRESVTYEVGDGVRIIDGPFLGFNGVVDDVNYDQNKVKVLVTIFGRSTPMEVGFLQVERLK